MRSQGNSQQIVNAVLLGASVLAGSLTASGQAYAGFQLNSLTTTQRDALAVAPSAGAVIWNSTLGQMQAYNGSAWESADALSGGVITGAVTFSGTTHAGIALNNLTTTQRDALVTPATGSLIWNTTTTAVNVYSGAAWALVGGLTIGTSVVTSGTTTRILYNNAGVLGEYTLSGSGTVVAMATSPSFTTPTLGVATATSINKVAITAPASAATLTLIDGTTVTGPPATATVAALGISNAGHLLFIDATYDIGASGATRPRSIYAATTVQANSQVIGETVVVNTAGYAKFSCPSDGVLKVGNNANTDFGRFCFGGTTSSFPSLKRSSTVLQARLADDSAFAPLQGAIRVAANAATGLSAGVLAALTNASIVITDASGQDYRVPCVI